MEEIINNLDNQSKKKERHYRGTIKQRKTLAILAEKGGKISLGEAMRQGGYSNKVSENPVRLTESKGFLALAEEYLPDLELLKTHQEGLKATKIHSGLSEPDQLVPDYQTRHKYLVTAYDIKGRIKNSPTIFAPIQINVDEDREKFK